METAQWDRLQVVGFFVAYFSAHWTVAGLSPVSRNFRAEWSLSAPQNDSVGANGHWPLRRILVFSASHVPSPCPCEE